MSRRRNDQSTSRKLIYVGGFLVLAAVISAAVLATRKSPPAPVSGPVHKPAPAEPDERSVFATYGGSASCKSCHEQEYRLWQTSHHALAERLINTNEDAAAFTPARTIRHATQTSQAIATNGQFQLVTAGLDSQQRAFTAERVIGKDPLRQFIMRTPGGRFQVTELAFDPSQHEWFDVYGEEDRRPGEWGHWTGRGMTWNVMCAACHNTRLRKHYDDATDAYATTMAEMSVGCEACHGPMAAHNAWQRANSARPVSGGVSTTKDPTTRHISRDQMLGTCGSCHSRRAELTGEFIPGESFADHYVLSVPDDTDLFYPDGQVREEDYEMTAFLGSKMQAAGLRCADCHDPHSGKTRVAGNNLCTSCHASGVSVSLALHNGESPAAPLISAPAPRIDPRTHTHHETGKAGDSCVDCHMPVTTYMQRHARHDHGFTIPDPLLTKEFRIPNACGRCHKDRDVDWAVANVEKWYGTRMERPSRERARILARAKAGDSASPEKLIRLMQTETNAFWRAVSAGFMRRWVAESNVTAALVGATQDPDPLVRAMSARALEPLVVRASVSGEAGPVLAVHKALDDPARAVRIDAAWDLRNTLDTNSAAGRDLLGYLRHSGDQPSGAMQTGVFMMDRGDDAEAIRFLSRAVRWDTNSAPPHHALAVAFSTQGKSEEALRELQTACRIAPRDADLQFKLGLALNEVGNREGARAALGEAVKLDPQFAQAWYNLGLAHNMSGDSEQALQSLLRAESLDGNSPQIPYARAAILARLGRMEEARAAARRAIEIRPDYSEADALLRSLSQ
jgi:predicted CXXCH cytochrome family protein